MCSKVHTSPTHAIFPKPKMNSLLTTSSLWVFRKVLSNLLFFSDNQILLIVGSDLFEDFPEYLRTVYKVYLHGEYFQLFNNNNNNNSNQTGFLFQLRGRKYNLGIYQFQEWTYSADKRVGGQDASLYF